MQIGMVASGLDVSVLYRGDRMAVVYKPGGIACHRSPYSGARQLRSDEPPPLLQQARDLLGSRVNLVHRLDQGASGPVLVALDEDAEATTALSAALASGVKTYVAWCRGSGEALHAYGDGSSTMYRTPGGISHPVVATKSGWFEVDRPIKDNGGREREAASQFRLLAGVPGECRSCIVAARPQTGRWHQIRRHLNGLSHPILGDSTHGNHQSNRMWRQRGLHRLALHLHLLELPATVVSPPLSLVCPMSTDVVTPLFEHAPDLVPTIRKELPALLPQEVNDST